MLKILYAMQREMDTSRSESIIYKISENLAIILSKRITLVIV